MLTDRHSSLVVDKSQSLYSPLGPCLLLPVTYACISVAAKSAFRDLGPRDACDFAETQRLILGVDCRTDAIFLAVGAAPGGRVRVCGLDGRLGVGSPSQENTGRGYTLHGERGVVGARQWW